MNQGLSAGWLKVFIVIGLAASLFFLLFPSILESQTVAERERFEACQNHQRVDCDPSFLWAVQGLKNVAHVQ